MSGRAAPRPDGPPPPPVVQRLWVRYAKRGRMRFTSHRDVQRALERALRRAGVPVARSAGFTPHPKISYVGAAATGVASEAEYLELGLERVCDPELVRLALDEALPAGLDVLAVADAATAGPGTLPDRIGVSLWTIELAGPSAVDASRAVAEFMARAEVEVDRMTKDGVRRFDARGPVLELSATASPGPHGALAATAGEPESAGAPGVLNGRLPAGPEVCAILRLVVRHVTPAVRPDDVLTGLSQSTVPVPPSSAVRITRWAQGQLDDGGAILEPLTAERVPTGS